MLCLDITSIWCCKIFVVSVAVRKISHRTRVGMLTIIRRLDVSVNFASQYSGIYKVSKTANFEAPLEVGGRRERIMGSNLSTSLATWKTG